MPIANLSEDVLIEIFTLCSGMEWEHYSLRYVLLEWDWIEVTRVCRYWRALALSSPALWCRPMLARHSHDRLEKYLERSQGSPLTIDGSVRVRCYYFERCQHCEDNLRLALQHLYHIRELHISSAGRDIIELLCGGAPLLEDLSILMYGDTEPPLMLPVEFLYYGSSPLKRIYLVGCVLPYTSPVIDNLFSLTMYDSHQHGDKAKRHNISASSYPRIDELFLMLYDCMFIHTLALFTVQDVGPLKHVDLSQKGFRLNLPYLNRFEIAEVDVAVYQKLISHLEVPKSSTLLVTLRYFGSYQTPQILAILHRFSESRVCNYLTMSLRNYLHTCAREIVSASDATATHVFLRHTNDGGVMADEDEIDYFDTAAVMSTLVRYSYWRHTSRLSLTVGDRYTLDTLTWRTLFDSFSSVKVLEVMATRPLSSDNNDKYFPLIANILTGLMGYSSSVNFAVSESSPQPIIMPHLVDFSISVASIPELCLLLHQLLQFRLENDALALQYLRIKELGGLPTVWLSEFKNFSDLVCLYYCEYQTDSDICF